MRARITTTAVVASLLAAVVFPASAGADVPPDDEPSLFVVHAPVSHDDGVLTVRTKRLEWLTDRPNRKAGSLTSKELADHWSGWGFEDDPPNAALVGDDTDVIGELTKPRVRGGALRFDFEPIQGTPGNGDLGKVSVLIDPTGPASLSLTAINNSQNAQDFVVYQTDGSGQLPNALPVAWLARPAYPSTQVTFQWDQSYQLMVGQTGELRPGITFSPQRTIDVNPGSQNDNGGALSYDGSTFQLAPQPGVAPAGSIGLRLDATIPPGQGVAAIGQSGAAVFAFQAQPNFNVVFRPQPRYWIAAGSFQTGQVLDPESITNAVEIPFPSGVTAMTATLQPDNTWTVQPS